MASKTLAIFLCINVLFYFTIVAACNTCPPTPKPKPKPKPKPTPTPTPTPAPPTPTPAPPTPTKCPRDALKLGICADLLGSLLNVTIGTPPKTPCCSLLEGLLDLEAAVCLCTAIKADVLGIHLDIPLSLTLLLNVCEKKVPPGFQCA